MRTVAPWLLAASIGLLGCTPRAGWVVPQGRFTSEGTGLEADPPAGWMRFDNPKAPDRLLLTRDGTTLQRIVGGVTEVGKPLPIGGSKRLLAAGMTPAELAELVVDGLAANEGTTDARILENAPARLGGLPGLRVVASFREGKLEQRVCYYGALHGARLYWLFYVAPARRYFELDAPTFEAVVRSARIRGVAAPATQAPAAPVTPVAPPSS